MTSPQMLVLKQNYQYHFSTSMKIDDMGNSRQDLTILFDFA